MNGQGGKGNVSGGEVSLFFLKVGGAGWGKAADWPVLMTLPRVLLLEKVTARNRSNEV